MRGACTTLLTTSTHVVPPLVVLKVSGRTVPSGVLLATRNNTCPVEVAVPPFAFTVESEYVLSSRVTQGLGMRRIPEGLDAEALPLFTKVMLSCSVSPASSTASLLPELPPL